MAVDIGQITAEAWRTQPGDVAAKALRLLLVVIARVLWGVGWIVRKTFAAVWLATTWSWTAIKLGWQDASPNPRR